MLLTYFGQFSNWAIWASCCPQQAGSRVLPVAAAQEPSPSCQQGRRKEERDICREHCKGPARPSVPFVPPFSSQLPVCVLGSTHKVRACTCRQAAPLAMDFLLKTGMEGWGPSCKQHHFALSPTITAHTRCHITFVHDTPCLRVSRSLFPDQWSHPDVCAAAALPQGPHQCWGGPPQPATFPDHLPNQDPAHVTQHGPTCTRGHSASLEPPARHTPQAETTSSAISIIWPKAHSTHSTEAVFDTAQDMYQEKCGNKQFPLIVLTFW